MEDHSHWPARIIRGKRALEAYDPDSEVRKMSPEQRLAMAHELIAHAYTFAGYDLAECELSRHVERVTRRER
jgi:hypothetical protein